MINDMKDLKIFTFIATVLFFISSCTEQEELFPNVERFDDLVFQVNVDCTDNTRAQSDGKTGWTEGDKIIFSIDGSRSNLCYMTFDGEDWCVEQIENTAIFNKNTGVLHAIFADNIDYSSGEITTQGDILYTKNGSYSKDGKIVFINLKMNKRPIAKIKLQGVPEGYWIEDLKMFSKVDIAEMTWEDALSNSSSYREDEGDNTYTYYGLISPEEKGTTIKLTNTKGQYYIKTFESIISAGDYINISGPLAVNDWQSIIPIQGLSSSGSATLLINGTGSIYDYFSFNPNNTTQISVTFTSSNDKIVTIDESGTMTAKSNGTAKITIKSTEGDYSCDVSVTVANLQDLVSISLYGTGITFLGGSMFFFKEYKIVNNSPVDIKLVSLSTSNSQSLGYTLKAHSSTTETLYFNYNVSPKVTLTYSYDGRSYSTSTN